METGRSVPVLDGLGHYLFSLPSKLLLLNWQIDNHDISPETEQALRQYLTENHLENVKIRINQYAPGGEWHRLINNTGMPGFFRFTIGALSAGIYTILPGRLFGGDSYNPYTNTINLYSDSTPVALHEAAHAKDFTNRSRKFRGWYALMGILPFMPLYQEAKATGDVIGYTREQDLITSEKDAYQTLYPAYATYIAGEGIRWLTLDPWAGITITLAVTIPAHIAGRIKASLTPARQEEMTDKTDP